MQASSRGRLWPFLITEVIKEVSPLLPCPHHHQDYDRSVFPRVSGFTNSSSRQCVQGYLAHK